MCLSVCFSVSPPALDNACHRGVASSVFVAPWFFFNLCCGYVVLFHALHFYHAVASICVRGCVLLFSYVSTSLDLVEQKVMAKGTSIKNVGKKMGLMKKATQTARLGGDPFDV